MYKYIFNEWIFLGLKTLKQTVFGFVNLLKSIYKIKKLFKMTNFDDSK